tara:strand:- start:70256 stop:70639 length:384 start_codon:yes stop_codon:yes gene_type:complete
MQRGYVLIFAAALALACGSDDRPAEWGYIHEAIIRQNCATVSCHTGQNAAAGLRLQEPEQAYATLVGLPCGTAEQGSGGFVVPGQPESSRLVTVLRGSDITMPPDRPLSLQDVELIEAWIAGGAPCD